MKKKIEIIYWRDVHGLKIGWSNIDEAKKEAEKMFKAEMYSVGFVIFDNKDYVIIAATSDGCCNDEENFNDISMIPKSEIVSRKIISEIK